MQQLGAMHNIRLAQNACDLTLNTPLFWQLGAQRAAHSPHNVGLAQDVGHLALQHRATQLSSHKPRGVTRPATRAWAVTSRQAI